MLQLGGNGDFEEKDIKIINTLSEYQENYERYWLLLSLEVESIFHQGHVLEGVAENIGIISFQRVFLGIKIMII
jgi:hypothetical protein